MLRAAIWGVGKWGQTLVDAVQGVSDTVRFTTAIARTPAKYEDFARSRGLRLTDDVDTVLADRDVDAVVIATANTLHPEHARMAAAAGKHVFVEKPFGVSAADAAAAVEACARAGVILAVGFNRRFLPLVRELRAMVADGALGEVLHLEGQFSGPTGLRMSPASWRGTAVEAPGGGMTARGIHVLDAMIGISGPVRSVFGISERRVLDLEMDDVTAMLLRFDSGVTGYLSTIMATADYWRLQVIGTRGHAEMRGPRTLVVADLEGAETVREYPPIDIERAELEAFAAAASGGGPYPVPAADAVEGVAVLEALVRSAGTGSPVEVSAGR